MNKFLNMSVVFLFLMTPVAAIVDPSAQAIIDQAHRICDLGRAPLQERQALIEKLESLTIQDPESETAILAKASLADLAQNKFYSLDDEQIFEWIQQAADLGNACAINNLGGCYEHGIGVAKDKIKACELYQKAAELGNASAIQNFWFLYVCDGCGRVRIRFDDSTRAFDLFQKEAHLGLANALNNLGVCFRDGKGVSQDERAALDLFEKAADMGHSDAIYNMAIYCKYNSYKCYSAFNLFEKAAELDHLDAIYNLGVCFRYGEGVWWDHTKAFELFKNAAYRGHSAAICNLGECYEKGKGVSIDTRHAAQLHFIGKRAGVYSFTSSYTLSENEKCYLNFGCDLFGFSKTVSPENMLTSDEVRLTDAQADQLSDSLLKKVSTHKELREGLFEFMSSFRRYDSNTDSKTAFDPLHVILVPAFAAFEDSLNRDLCLFPIEKAIYDQLESANYSKYKDKALTFPLTPQLQVYKIQDHYYASVGHANVNIAQDTISLLYGKKGKDLWETLNKMILAQNPEAKEKTCPELIVLGMIRRRMNAQMKSLIQMAGQLKGHNLPESLVFEDTTDFPRLNPDVLRHMVLRPRPPTSNDDDSGQM